MPRQWYVGVSKQGRETLARRELERQSFEVYLPMYVPLTGKRIRPFLTSYLFISLDPDNERWRAINSTFGMRHVLPFGERPRAISSTIVDGIKEREIDGLVRLPPKVACKFKKGDHIAIKGNPVEALFEEVLDHRRALVFLSLLGRPNRLIVPLSKLAPASFPGAVAVA